MTSSFGSGCVQKAGSRKPAGLPDPRWPSSVSKLIAFSLHGVVGVAPDAQQHQRRARAHAAETDPALDLDAVHAPPVGRGHQEQRRGQHVAEMAEQERHGLERRLLGDVLALERAPRARTRRSARRSRRGRRARCRAAPRSARWPPADCAIEAGSAYRLARSAKMRRPPGDGTRCMRSRSDEDCTARTSRLARLLSSPIAREIRVGRGLTPATASSTGVMVRRSSAPIASICLRLPRASSADQDRRHGSVHPDDAPQGRALRCDEAREVEARPRPAVRSLRGHPT